MAAFARTVTLPIRPGSSWDDFAWDPKYPGDELDYTLDCTDWLTDANRAIVNASASVSAGLTVVASNFGLAGELKTSVIMRLTDGIPLTVSTIALDLILDSGRTLTVVIALPIRAALPSGLIPYVPPSTTATIGGTRITIGGNAITI